MKNINKLPLIFLAILSVIISAKNLFAQSPGLNIAGDMYARSATRKMRLNYKTDITTDWKSATGKGRIYQVTFKDKTVKEVGSYMYTDTILHKNFLVFVDKKFQKSDTVHRNQKIYPDQTLYISTISDEMSQAEVYGVPTDSCWMFKVMAGPISVYAKSFGYLMPAENPNDQEFDMWDIIGIQLNDGPIVKLTDDNLKKMIGQDKNALEALEKKKYYKTIKKFNRHADKAD
jgi:hypothetical protein